MKKRFLVRRGLLAGSLLVGTGGGALVVTGRTGGRQLKQVTAVGSFTTYLMMHNLFRTSLNDQFPGGTTATQQIVATPRCAPSSGQYQ